MTFNTFFSNGPSAVKNFEIRPEKSVLVLRGDDQEASSVLLKGNLVLCLSEPLAVKNIHLRLTGKSRISLPAVDVRSRSVKQECDFFHKSWTFPQGTKNKVKTLKSGNYDFPFQVVIEGNMPESVEGLDYNWIIYRMKATIERGRLAHNISSRKHLRIVRTLGPSALELAHAMSVENIWPEKVEYSLSVPNKAIVFGTAARVDIRLVPLLKGLKIGRIQIKLTEVQDFVAFESRYRSYRDVAVADCEIEEHSESVELNGQEGYILTRTLQLPKTLRECIQDVDILGLKIRHKLNFNVALKNPDGHTSELRATLPLSIFISPNLPLDEFNNLVNPNPLDAQAIEGLEQHAPPLYGEHQFDQLYSDIDPSGYMTPAGNLSGANSPFASRSRSGSTDNLDSLDAVTQGSITPQQLQQRLSNLPNMTRRGSENTLSRHPSDEDRPSNPHTPNLLGMDREALSKVPSYNTAVRTPAPAHGDYLPDYTETQTGSSHSSPNLMSEEDQSRVLTPIPLRLRPPDSAHLHNTDDDREISSDLQTIHPQPAPLIT